MTWRWVERPSVLGIHAAQLETFGGALGIRDEGLLESALMRPRNLTHYGEPDVFELAAAYAFGLARNHPFVDGNKRVAAVVSLVFLEKNGQRVAAAEADLVITFLKLAAGEMSEAELAGWFRAHSGPPDDAFLAPEQDQ